MARLAAQNTSTAAQLAGVLPDLYSELLSLVRQVPAGRVTTFGSLARAMGDVAASRWVGAMVGHQGLPEDCPWHRIVRASGELGGPARASIDERRRQLQREGSLLPSGKADLEGRRFDRFRGSRPLHRLAQLQNRWARQAVPHALNSRPGRIAGLDLAYPNDRRAVAAYALVDAQTDQLVWSTTLEQSVSFPYIRGYLGFRELPLLAELVEQADRTGASADVLLVDGSGILHPRRCGVATMLGVLLDRPTIGITKKHLVGSYSKAELTQHRLAPVTVDGEVLGSALLVRTGSAHPLFVSPGNYFDWMTAARITQRTLTQWRLPTPIYWADRLGRRQIKPFSLTKPPH
jgi:deoxyribonuclease V